MEPQQLGNSNAAQEKPKKERGEDPKESSKQAGKEDPKIRELLKERVETLRKRLDFTMNMWKAGERSMGSEILIPALSQLFHAELDFCELDQERFVVCERNLTLAKEYEKLISDLAKTGETNSATVLAFVALRLEVEIAYERAKAKVKGAK